MIHLYNIIYSLPKGELTTATVIANNEQEAETKAIKCLKKETGLKKSEITIYQSEEIYLLN